MEAGLENIAFSICAKWSFLLLLVGERLAVKCLRAISSLLLERPVLQYEPEWCPRET